MEYHEVIVLLTRRYNTRLKNTIMVNNGIKQDEMKYHLNKNWQAEFVRVSFILFLAPIYLHFINYIQEWKFTPKEMK
jgi:hypothetical protein